MSNHDAPYLYKAKLDKISEKRQSLGDYKEFQNMPLLDYKPPLTQQNGSRLF